MQTAHSAEYGRPHRNHGLFSDHYLDATLPRRPRWEELVERAKPAMEAVADVFASYTPSTNEAQTLSVRTMLGLRRDLAPVATELGYLT